MRNPVRRGLSVLSALIVAAVGCAHRRPAYESSDLGPTSGVHVRAPFVDVRVKGKDVRAERISRPDDREERLSERRGPGDGLERPE